MRDEFKDLGVFLNLQTPGLFNNTISNDFIFPICIYVVSVTFLFAFLEIINVIFKIMS